jgi:hypothetical protein
MDDITQNQQPLQATSNMPQTSDGIGDDQVATVVAQGGLGVVQPPTSVVPPTPLPKPPELISVPNKEMPIGQAETVPLVELKEEERIPEDVQGWVEKLQKENVSLPEPVMNKDEVVLAEPHVTFVNDKIVLPITRQSFAQHAHAKVTESARWLVEWCKRLILMQGEEKTKFRD